MNTLTAAVRAALETAGLWREGVRILVAVSGGCDSIALLHAASRLRPFAAVHAIHVQHGLRGEDSLADEQFVRRLCGELDLPLTVENADLTGDMHTPGMETAARESRRRIFAKQLSATRSDVLLTAHHRDDQTETVLMHLLRGCGLHGLCGMPAVSVFGDALLIRPFLKLSKAQLQAALESENLSFREDASNFETLTPRNTLRLSVIPQLEQLFANAGEHIANLSQTLAADEDFLSAEADALYSRCLYAKAPLFMLRRKPLAQAHEAIRRRALRRWFAEGLAAANLTPDERALCLEDTCALSQLALGPSGACLNLPCGLHALCTDEWLHLTCAGKPLQNAESYVIPLCAEAEECVLPHLTLSLAKAEALPKNAWSIVLSPEVLSLQPVWRTPDAQDVIRPFGAPGHKPLRRFFTDRKVDALMRGCFPVLAVGSEILWIPGLCASEAARLDHMPQGSIQLTVIGDTPFKSPKE